MGWKWGIGYEWDRGYECTAMTLWGEEEGGW